MLPQHFNSFFIYEERQDFNKQNVLNSIFLSHYFMMKLSTSEENYLKEIFKLSENSGKNISTNNIASAMQTAPASVSDMIKKLSDKQLIFYEKYYGVSLTKKGKSMALALIRKHRLWEVFLVDKLKFQWDQIHEVAEELEHISSNLLVERLDEFLNFPKFDPHGDPIPDKHGNVEYHNEITLDQLKVHDEAIIVGVNDQSPAFLQFLDQQQFHLKNKFSVISHHEYDHSKTILMDNQTFFVSEKVGKNLVVKKI